MKKNIHPENYRLCVFKDISTDYAILTKSKMKLMKLLSGMMVTNTP